MGWCLNPSQAWDRSRLVKAERPGSGGRETLVMVGGVLSMGTAQQAIQWA